MKTGTTPLKTARLFLRQFTLSDAKNMFENYCNDEEVTKYLIWNKHENIQTTVDYLNTFVSQYPSPLLYRWAIVDKETNQVIGAIDAVRVDVENNLCELGWVLSKKYWNKGMMTEAAKAVMEYLVGQGFTTFCAKFDAKNIASGKVMSNIGMAYEKLEKDVEYRAGSEKVDLIHFSRKIKQK